MTDQELVNAHIKPPNQTVLWELICRSLEHGEHVKTLLAEREARVAFEEQLDEINEEREQNALLQEKVFKFSTLNTTSRNVLIECCFLNSIPKPE